MNKIQKLLKVGDTVFSAAGGEPMKVTSISSVGFETEFDSFLYEEVRSLFFLTRAGYENAKAMCRAEKERQMNNDR